MSLTTISPRPFVVRDEATWDEKTAVIDDWRLPTRAIGELNLNREAHLIDDPSGHRAFKGRRDVLARFHAGFDWQADDDRSRSWIPQGLTGDGDRGADDGTGRKWLAVSWHNEEAGVEKGMRMSFVDVTEWEEPLRYRHVLLVNPIAADDGPGGHVSFAAIPAHAGGAVWFRDYLYVADSRGYDAGKPGGLLVFDMTRIAEVDSSRDDRIGWSPEDETYHALGYRYVLPQVGRYVQVADGGDGRLRWSFIGLDRTGPARSLAMGEYVTSDRDPGRLVWWPLDEGSGRIATSAGEREASLARACTSERFLQGCHSSDALADGTVWLSRSSGHDALYERPLNGDRGATREPWADQPEGLTYSPGSDNLWCVTERPGARAVFAVKRSRL